MVKVPINQTAFEFVVPSEWSRKRLGSYLKERLNLRAENVDSGLEFFDTFDWLVHRAGWLLEFTVAQNKVARLRRLADGQVVEQPLLAEPSRFVRDWPLGPVRSVLIDIVGVRALLPRVSASGTADGFAVLNADAKTVCRLSIERWRMDDPQSRDKAAINPATEFSRIRITPMRGWDSEARRVADTLSGAGFVSADRNTMESMLAAIDSEPRDYSQKFTLTLDPEQAAHLAARTILTRLFDDLTINEEGTRLDIDPEFLHDYRVAVRRTRSALWAFRNLFGRETLEPFAMEFHALGQLTGDKRNLDVHLIDFDDHLKHLEPSQQAAMEVLRKLLQSRMEAAGKALAAHLKSAAYRRFKRDWKTFLSQTTAHGPSADQAVRKFADAVIYKAYKGILKKGRSIKRRSPDEALHKLRKRAKQFRYLMEFFSNLYAPGDIKRTVKELKRMQDLLGQFQDVCVQIGTLRYLLSEDESSVVRSALNPLLAGLDVSRQQLRSDFDSQFKRFDSSKNRALYAKLFSEAGGDS
ncbi:MAG: CHAD domain-containing protein [marine bacterium B5-7]|nr:MAG: CHAD domain-containing protein [marine bacterium B5-7]